MRLPRLTLRSTRGWPGHVRSGVSSGIRTNWKRATWRSGRVPQSNTCSTPRQKPDGRDLRHVPFAGVFRILHVRSRERCSRRRLCASRSVRVRAAPDERAVPCPFRSRRGGADALRLRPYCGCRVGASSRSARQDDRAPTLEARQRCLDGPAARRELIELTWLDTARASWLDRPLARRRRSRSVLRADQGREGRGDTAGLHPAHRVGRERR